MGYFTHPKGELTLTEEDIYSRRKMDSPQKLEGLSNKPRLLKHISDLKIISQMYRISKKTPKQYKNSQ